MPSDDRPLGTATVRAAVPEPPPSDAVDSRPLVTWDALLAEPPDRDPGAALLRPHCDKCGRFIRQATVRTVTHWEGLDHDQYGHCSVCGEVGVTWSEPRLSTSRRPDRGRGS